MIPKTNFISRSVPTKCVRVGAQECCEARKYKIEVRTRVGALGCMHINLFEILFQTRKFTACQILSTT